MKRISPSRMGFSRQCRAHARYFQANGALRKRIFVNLGSAYPTNTILEFPTHCHCTKSSVEIIVCRRIRIQYYVILQVGGSAKREKATTTTTNDNNRRIIEIKAMDEPTYEDITRMEQDDGDEEEEEYKEYFKYIN